MCGTAYRDGYVLRSAYCVKGHRTIRRLGAVVLLCLLTSCRSEKQEAKAPKPSDLPQVEFVQVARHDFKEMREIQGVLHPNKTNTVIAQLDTRVVQCSVKVGDRVKAGQVIAQLDRKPTEQKVRAARAQLSKAIGERDSADQESQRLTRELDETRAELASFETRLAEVKSEATRAEVALTQAREAAAQAKAPPATPDSSAKIPALEAEVSRFESAVAQATESAKRRLEERQAAEKRFAKSQELYDVGAISRNANEADRKKVDSAKQAEQAATATIEKSRKELTESHANLAKMRDMVRAELAARAAKTTARPPSAPITPEIQQTRLRVEESARALTRVAEDIRRSHERIDSAQKDLKQLEPRLVQARENLTKANEELANQTVLLGYCEVKATGDGIVTSIRRKGTAVRPGEVLCAIDDDSMLHFVPEGIAPEESIPNHFSLRSSVDQREVSATVERDDKRELIVRIVNADHSLSCGAARLEFVKEERKERPAVLATAVIRADGKFYVFSATENGAKPSAGRALTIVRREVSVGATERDTVEVASGLDAGAWVVTHPVRDWRERREVRAK